MKCSAPKLWGFSAVLVSGFVLLKIFIILDTPPEEVVLPLPKTRTLGIVQQTIRSIYEREPRLTQQGMLNKMGSRNASDIIHPYNSTVYIQPDDLDFRQDSWKPRTSILIIVTSVPNATEKRNIVRSTWVKRAKQLSDEYFIRTVFFTGLPKSSHVSAYEKLLAESKLHKDLVVDDFTESYFTLTPKTLRMLKWYVLTFQQLSPTGSRHSPDFIIKTDHDVFINIPNLGLYLSSVLANASDSSTTSSSSSSSSDDDDSLENTVPLLHSNSFSKVNNLTIPSWYFIGGEVYRKPRVVNDPTSKFYISTKFWLGRNVSHYPSHVAGPMYILSANIVPVIYRASLSVPLFPFEDVYLTGMVVVERLKLVITHVPGVESEFYDTLNIIRNNSKMRRMISLHPMEPPERMYSVLCIANNVSRIH